MKLLFDQNISFRLPAVLNDLYPDSKHVKVLGFEQVSDTEIWDYAKDQGFVIVSKDSDFHQRSLLFGPPPKVIWIRKGNCTTQEIIKLLKDYVEDVRAFVESEESSFLVL